jgi:UDP-N-acetylglucosamine diphosphorylase/glucosamine-1-phosphate N-acetyltransferase
MKILLFDDAGSENFLPLSYTRPVSDFLIGMLTQVQRFEIYFNTKDIDVLAYRSYLNDNSLTTNTGSEPTLSINSRWLVTTEEVEILQNLSKNSTIITSDGVVLGSNVLQNSNNGSSVITIEHTPHVFINYPEDIFRVNGEMLMNDFSIKTKGKVSAEVGVGNIQIGNHPIFLEEGASVNGAFLNTNDGPIYVSANAEIMEGSMVRGPFFLGEHSALKMGAKIYGPTTIGPESKFGGEVNNCVVFGYSNKAHDGFLGNSVIGKWCNLGADTNNSNLKNNYDIVKLWDLKNGTFRSTGLQFCGLIMGDHAKAGINTMFNTGTVVGVGANVFGAGFPRNYIPSFAWGGASGFETFRLHKFFETTTKVMERRGILLTDSEKQKLKCIFDETQPNRTWESKQ